MVRFLRLGPPRHREDGGPEGGRARADRRRGYRDVFAAALMEGVSSGEALVATLVQFCQNVLPSAGKA